jgi:site-specific DNA-methyltransferase (adenine-specific)
MKFDVIIGNPPYQMSDGGFGRSAAPIYNKFVEQAKKLKPRFLLMIIPSRWFAGGKGLDEFRNEMLNDRQISTLVDFEDASEVFPGVGKNIAGGVCYFLWQSGYAGECEIRNVLQGTTSSSVRRLNEYQTLIRTGVAVNIVRKIDRKEPRRLSDQVSSRKPFGLPTNARPAKSGDLLLRWSGGIGPFSSNDVPTGKENIDKWKVITSKASFDHAGMPDKNGMRKVFSLVEILPPGTICTETYIVVGYFNCETDAQYLLNYLKTRFVRFLVAQLSFSQDITKDRFALVPLLNPKVAPSDQELFRYFDLSESESDFICSKIREME